MQKESKTMGAEEFMAQQIEDLYSMDCFDTMVAPNGMPLVTRVPGGWIWCISSGGAHIQLEDNQAIVGKLVLSTVFVPFDNEFMPERRVPFQ